jgi:hypothetical protein
MPNAAFRIQGMESQYLEVRVLGFRVFKGFRVLLRIDRFFGV